MKRQMPPLWLDFFKKKMIGKEKKSGLILIASLMILIVFAAAVGKRGLVLPAEAAKSLQLKSFMPVVSLTGTNGFETIQSNLLREMFARASSLACVPESLLLAISKREAGRTWSYSDDQVVFFKTPNWWEQAGVNEICLGLGYDTCQSSFCQPEPPPCAPGASVMGPMQFEARTFEGYRSFIEPILGRFSDRRILEDAVLAAAFKMKANSGTGSNQCQAWSEATVRQVAQAYCGACGGPSCGYNYCDDVYLRYLQYQAREP